MSAAGTVTTSDPRSETVVHLQQAFKLALSLVVFYAFALWMNWDLPRYGALAIVIISLGTTGASIQKGVLRFVGTTVGVAVGFLLLGLFSHDRWATMFAFAAYLTVIGYFMQASRYSYAWYVAAFVPLVVWGDTYPNFDSAFYFGTFRYLETTAGILIYTVVDIIFWPHSAADQLKTRGRIFWAEVQQLFVIYRQQFEDRRDPAGAADLRAKLAGSLSQTVSALQDAYADTPAVRARKPEWETLRVNARALVDAVNLWGTCIDDCRALDLDQLLPEFHTRLEMLESRLQRIGALWEMGFATDSHLDINDSPLPETPALILNSEVFSALSHFERAAVMSFVGQMDALDQASRELLQTMHSLAGREPRRRVPNPSQPVNENQPSRLELGRLIHALYPPVVFITAFVFWIIVNPPTGPKIPMFAGILSLVILQTPMNPLNLMAVFLLSVLFVVAPIYWLVMPGLGTGWALLSLVFVYSFVFGYLGERTPALKSGPLIMFVVMSGISNQQHYSFTAPVDGALMILLAGSIVTLVYFMFSPMRPEQALIRSLRRFFHGCARVTGGLAANDHSVPARRQEDRRRYLKSMVHPAPDTIRTIEKRLNYKLYRDIHPENVRRLPDSMQSIADRLQALEVAHDRIACHASEFPESLVALGARLGELLQTLFERWASLEPGDGFEQQRGALEQLSCDLLRQLKGLDTRPYGRPIDDRVLVDLYTMLGAVRGLIAAMTDAQGVINKINFQQLAVARF